MPSYAHELWSDSQLAIAHVEGDPNAFPELYRRFHPRLVRLIRRRLGDEATAQDMAQEALVRALQKFDAYDTSRPLWPWIRRIALNAMIDLFRRTPIPVDPAGVTHHAVQADPAAQACDRFVLSEAMQSVPSRQQAALWLRYVEDLDSLQAAGRLGMSRGAYDQLLFRARRSLLRQLKALGESGPAIVIAPLWWRIARTLTRMRDKATVVWQSAGGASAAGLATTTEAAVVIAGVLALLAGVGPVLATTPKDVGVQPERSVARGERGTSNEEAVPAAHPRTRRTPAPPMYAATASAGRTVASVRAEAQPAPHRNAAGFRASGAVTRDKKIRGRASQDANVGEDDVWHDSEAVWDCTAGNTGRTVCGTFDTAADTARKPPPPLGP